MTIEGGQSGQNLLIQMLRGFAALLVVIGHAIHETLVMGPALGRAPLDGSLVHWGLGVDVFFVISGFIMVYSSQQLFQRPGAWRVFLRRRIIRIVPLYWLLTSLLLAGALVAPGLLNVPIAGWQHVLASYLFIPSLRTAEEIRPVMALGWTLNLEMFFYLLFAAVLVLPLRRAVLLLAAVLAALATYGFVMAPQQVQLAFWTQSIILEFGFGCLLALAYLRGLRLSLLPAVLVGLTGVIGLLRLPGLEGGALPEALRWGLPALAIVAAAALYDGQAAQGRSSSRLLLAAAAFGNASYSLYLIHPFVLRPMRNLWLRLVGDGLPLASYVAVAAAASCLVAILLYLAVERPMLRWMQGRRRQKSSGAADAAASAFAQRSLRTTT
jgi:peptidoglycan/LPS O-acetylase OafA/YrhL